MGWRGAGGNGASDTGVYFFFGGLLMVLGALGEVCHDSKHRCRESNIILTLGQWIIGNTFPFVVFGSFGAFWLSFGATLQPFYNSYGAFSTNPANPAEGLTSPVFNASFGTSSSRVAPDGMNSS